MTLIIIWIVVLMILGFLAMINEYGKGNVFLAVGGFIMLAVGLVVCLLVSLVMIK